MKKIIKFIVRFVWGSLPIPTWEGNHKNLSQVKMANLKLKWQLNKKWYEKNL